MTCMKSLTLTGYSVQYVDLRDAKPRTVREEVYPMDEDAKAACLMLGLGVTDFIRSRYERGGYHVTSVQKLGDKRQTAVNLRHLWEDAEK